VPRLRIGCVALFLAAVLAPPASAQTPLTPEQFALLDTVYTTAVAAGDDPSAQDYAAVQAACRALGSADPLASLRRSCAAEIKTGRALTAFTACGTPLGCLRSARRARLALTEAISRTRAANTAVNAAGLVPACRRVLRTSQAELRLLERLRSFLGLVQQTLTTGSRTLARRVEREADAVDRLSDQQPSAARKRKQFRAACAPPPA
jgi:hypothetical protein